MILNTHYAYGAGVSGAVIVVTAPTGSTVTASLDGVVYTAQENNGTWTFKIRKFGTYTINATLGNQTASTTVAVTEKITYNVTLDYDFLVNINSNISTDWRSTDAWVTYNGTTYPYSTSFRVPKGTSIGIHAFIPSSSKYQRGIYINGTQVTSNTGNNNYTYTVNRNITVELTRFNEGGSRANIVEQ